MKAIGQHYTNSGLQSVWVESSVFCYNTASNNMEAKSYNRTIRAHKLTLEALWLNLWPQFLGWAKDQGFDDADLQRLSKQLAHSLDDNGEDETPSELMATAGRCSARCTSTPITRAVCWIHYMNMVIILLIFIRAERSSDWQIRSVLTWRWNRLTKWEKWQAV